MAISETYSNGLYFIIPLLGDAFVFLIIGYFLAPRMGAFVGVFGCAGEIAIQFKVSSVLLQMLFSVTHLYATAISAFIVIFYAAFGGIRSVTFTDLISNRNSTSVSWWM